MGAELVRKFSNIAMRSCYVSALRHPLLLVMVFHLIWMYRSFPFLFSLLMYASPVIVSTGILLGTLLFYGHQNVAKIPKPRHHHIVHNQKAMAMEIDGSSSGGEETCLVNNNIKINAGIQTDSGSKLSRKEAKGEEKLVLLEPKNTKLKLQGNFAPGLSWKSGEKHRDEDNKAWETGSEVAESSSPMAHIFPMLQVPHMSTDVASDHSMDSTDVVNDTDDYDDDIDDDDDQEDVQVKDDEDEDEEEEEEEEEDEEEEEEEANVDKEDDDASLTWTEDDQKNLGTPEVERRNQRLETMITRQRVLKNMRIMAEKNMNMVDLSPDLPFNSTLISSSRKTPFDSSVMVPRRNHLEKSDTDSIPFQPNHPFESCDLDPSTSTQGFKVGSMNPDVTNYSSMHTHKGERNESSMEHTKDDPSREANLTCIKDDYHTSKASQINRSFEDDDTMKLYAGQVATLDEDKTSVMDEADNQEKTSSNWSSSPLSDLTDHIYDEKEGDKNLNYFRGPDISTRHHSPPTEYQHMDNKEEQTNESSHHKGTYEDKIISRPQDTTVDKPTRYVEDQNNKEQQSTVKASSYHTGTCQEKIISRPKESSLIDRSLDKSAGYVEDQNELVPDNKEQQSTAFEEENISQPEELSLSLTDRSPEDQNKVVLDNKEQQSTVKTSSHHKDTSEENSVSRLEKSSLTDRSPEKSTRYVNEAAPDNKEHLKTSSHHKDTSEDNSVSRLEESSLTTRYVKDQNEVVPDNKEQQSTLNASSHHKDTYDDNISSRPVELSLMSGSTDKPTRFDEDQKVVVPDNREQDSTLKASSHHKDTSEEKIISQPEELSLTDRSVDKPSRYAEDNKEEEPTVTSPHHNGTFVEKVIFKPEEKSSEKPLTQDSKELQIQEQRKHISPSNNSTSTTQVKVSTKSPEYPSNMNMTDDDDADDKSDIGDSSVYESGSDSDTDTDTDTDRSENANSEFASASESEMSRPNESRFPKRLSQVPQGLASWLTGWRV